VQAFPSESKNVVLILKNINYSLLLMGTLSLVQNGHDANACRGNNNNKLWYRHISVMLSKTSMKHPDSSFFGNIY
jgi:hypothetical protein